MSEDPDSLNFEAAVELGRRFVFVGTDGTDPQQTRPAVWIYDDQKDVLRRIRDSSLAEGNGVLGLSTALVVEERVIAAGLNEGDANEPPVWLSDDQGETWRRAAWRGASEEATIVALVETGEDLLALGSKGEILRSSDDGSTWSAQSGLSVGEGSVRGGTLTAGGDVLIAGFTGSGDTRQPLLAVSDDAGLTWDTSPPPRGSIMLVGAATIGGVLLVAGRGDDGAAVLWYGGPDRWTERVIDTDGELEEINAGPALAVLVGDDASGMPTAWLAATPSGDWLRLALPAEGLEDPENRDLQGAAVLATGGVMLFGEDHSFDRGLPVWFAR